MGWRQDVTPNLDPYVYNGGTLLTDWYGWCLATVRAAFSSPFSGPNAWSGWTSYAQHKHEDRDFPVGVYFPIWFSGYGGLGHVAIAYINDTGSMNIWTSPYTHTPYFYTGYHDIDALARGYGVTYAGWSEDIAGQRVIEYVDDTPAPPPDPKYIVVETYDPVRTIQLNKQPTYLWGMNYDFDFMKDNPVETHNAGEIWEVDNMVQHQDGYNYYRRPGQIDGFNIQDCDAYTPPSPEQPAEPTPTPEDPIDTGDGTPAPAPDPTPTPEPTPEPTPDPEPEQPSKTLWDVVSGWFAGLVKFLKSFKK